MSDNKIVKNASKGYGYTYSSLADLAKAGITIPKMRTVVADGEEYIEYFDGDNWQQGAKVVLMEMKGMNAAQAYGASLTYARRYTVQMAQSVACDDDKSIEDAGATATATPTRQSGINFDDIREHLDMLDEAQAVDEYAKVIAKTYPKMTEKQKKVVGGIFDAKRQELLQDGEQ